MRDVIHLARKARNALTGQTGDQKMVNENDPPKVDVKVRNALVKVKKIDTGERQTTGGIWLPKGNLGMQFEVVQVMGVGPGVLLDNGQYAGCDDLKVGNYVLVRVGEKRARQGMGGIQGQEIRSCLDLDLGSDSFILVHQNDILAHLENYVPPAQPERATKAESAVDNRLEEKLKEKQQRQTGNGPKLTLTAKSDEFGCVAPTLVLETDPRKQTTSPDKTDDLN